MYSFRQISVQSAQLYLCFKSKLLRSFYCNMVTPVAESGISQKVDGQNSIMASELVQEKPSPDSPDFGEAPDGGTRAWLVAAGGSSIFFCCLGFSNAFGSFEQYYLTHQLHAESPDNIAWIGSLSAFLQFAAGMVGGPLFDRFGAKACHIALLKFEPVC
jgi:hypothetical protein